MNGKTTRRALLASVLVLAAGLLAPPAAAETVRVTDIAGRTVEVAVPVKTMILGEGRFLPTLAILDPSDPSDRIVGMMADFERFDPAGYAQYVRKFPNIKNIPQIGHGSAESFSLEKSISVKPDVAIFGLGSGHGPGARHKAILDRLAAAGVPVVVVDFRMDPLVNTPKSIALLGRLLGRDAEAKAFNDFYTAELQRVADGLKGVTDKPKVFIEIHVGGRDDCCATMSQGMMGRFIDWAGGDNIAKGKVPGAHGLLSLEYLLVTQPDVYMATAIGAAGVDYPKPGRVVLGPGARADQARTSLALASSRRGIADLTAVKTRHAHAIWHHFYNTPLNVAAVQAMAKWIHPDRFQDLDPRKTLETLFAAFQPVPLDGAYWVSLDMEAAAQ
ncbi:MAG TPA: iron ABC transporter substrate-binding protein [Rhodospirillaceae bacterium]|nr:iron ABC transporter substrate-binding protein [Rhodospirillaceae bacterium]